MQTSSQCNFRRNAHDGRFIRTALGGVDIVQMRVLGSTGIEVSRIGLGCVTFGREIDEVSSLALLDHAVASGITLLDTAADYGGGQARAHRLRQSGVTDVREVSDEWSSSERILGQWLATRRSRDRVVLQTKLLPPLTRGHIVESLNESLRRLRSDAVDVYLLHAFDPQTPLDESLEGLGQVLRAGKARAVGCSNFTDQQLLQAHGLAMDGSLPHLGVSQTNYNLVVRDAAQSLFEACRRLNVGVQTYSPLGAGFLTGKYHPSAPAPPPGTRFHVMPGHAQVYFHDEKFEVVRRLLELSNRTGIPAVQLAVAWVLKHPLVDCTLIGARTALHIDNALAATELSFPNEWHHEVLGA